CRCLLRHICSFLFCFFIDTSTFEIYTLSLHDALPILAIMILVFVVLGLKVNPQILSFFLKNWLIILVLVPLGITSIFFSLSFEKDRKSTRLNSSHVSISYAVFCLKKKKK